jgi:hypothetical protein
LFLTLLIAAKSSCADDSPEKNREAIQELFAGPILSLELEIARDDVEALRKEPRRYVEGVLHEGKTVHRGVAIKLKGADGSFRPVDDKPGFTLNFGKYKGTTRFRGLKRLHLNNAREDPTFLRQLICGEMARAAGVPASRCTHALVKLNGRKLGLYVLVEGYTQDFLAQFFSRTDGDLYEGGFCKDIDAELTKDEGDAKDFHIIEQLIAAAREYDDAKRWTALKAVLDVDRYASFLAMESLMGVGDGYDFFRNNYRIYHDPVTKQLAFILHGMDQPLGDVNFPVQKHPESIVGQAFIGCPEGRKLYRERVIALSRKVFEAKDWPARVDEVAKKLCAAVEAGDRGLARRLAHQAAELRELVADRIKSIARQVDELGTPLEFDAKGVAHLPVGWHFDGDGAAHDEREMDGRKCLHLRSEGGTNASWRRSLELENGSYRFEARIRTRGVKAAEDDSGRGVGVRISGKSRIGGNSVTGDSGWQTVGYDFETDGGNVVLVAELRAQAGEVWFDAGSLRLVRKQR